MIRPPVSETGRVALKAQAGAAFRAGNLAAAQIILKRYVCLFSEDGAGYANLLAVARRRTVAISSLADLTRYALFADPDNSGPLVALLTACAEMRVPVPDRAAGFLARYDTDTEVTLAHAICLHGQRGARVAAVRVRRTLVFHPAEARLYVQAGKSLQGDDDSDAETAFLHALCCAEPQGREFAEAALNLAALRHAAGALGDAVSLYRASLRADPTAIDARANLAAALVDCGEPAAAEQTLRRTLVEKPQHWDALWLSSLLRIGEGDVTGGYRAHHVRWTEPHAEARTLELAALPLWLGQDPNGVRIFVWGDFGVGDEIVFSPLAAWLAGRGAAVVLEMDPRLVSLAQRSFPDVTVVPRGGSQVELGDFDFHAPSALLARFYARDGGRKALLPLRADPKRVSTFRKNLVEFGPGPKIGFSWGGGGKRTSWSKSTELTDWTGLLDTPDVTFVSLQYDVAKSGEGAGDWPRNLHPAPLEDLRNDLDGLAALITALDATVSISGVNAHMAGALRRPGFVLLPRSPLWFWGRKAPRTGWYPTLQLFRRADSGWGGPIAALTQAVRRFLTG
ncbi:tetratricopeptide repeat protein [Nisaea sp.]|uniref:tetratricopeptide repeat protein n=1 Tax=Nisaea sp. TaxID=2024842 RepID=UPI0032EEAF15